MPLFYRFVVYSLAGSITLMSLLVLPGVVGILTDHSALSESQAGLAASAGFLGSALIAMFLAFRMHHVNLRQVALLSFALALLGDGVSAFLTTAPEWFIAFRFLTGLGSGAAYTAILAAFARERHADRGFGLFITIQFLVSGIGLYLLPVFSEYISAKGLYLGFAALNLVGFVLCRHLPAVAPRSLEHALKVDELKVLLARTTLFGVVGFAIFEAANTAQFTYVDRYGVELDLSDQQLGVAMLLGSLAGIPGAFTIVLTGSRFGYVLPIALGVACSIAGLVLLIAIQQFYGYLLAFCLLGFGWAFCLPYIQGLLASLDRGGSAVAAGAAFSTIGGSAGPAIAALLLVDGRYHLVFLVAGAGLLLSVLSFGFTLMKERA